MQLDINDLKTLLSGPSQNSHSFKVGEAYFIRTITMHFTGRVTAITDTDIVLEDAAWIASSGRFYDCLKSGTLNEVEPYPNGVCVCRAGIIDFSVWAHDLPKEQK